MSKKLWFSLLAVIVAAATVLSACAPAAAPAPAPEKVTVVETKIVEVTAVPPPAEQKLEIFHWWTAPGEREAADAMFAAMKAAYPDVTVVENPVPGGGGTEHRVVLKARITAGIPPDTFQTLGGAELKDYVDSNVLQPLDDWYAATGYDKVIPKPLLNAVTINGHPYSVPLNMHLENILYYNKKLFDELGITAPTGYDEFVAACDKIMAAKPDMVCLDVGSKDNWSDVFVLDTIMMELGGPEYYVKFFKGEVDVANDPIFKESLEKFAALQKYSNMSDHSTLTWDQAVERGGLRAGSHDDHGHLGHRRLHQGLQLAAGRGLRRGELPDQAGTHPAVPPRYLWMHRGRSRSDGMPGLAERGGLARAADPHRRHPGRYVRTHGHRPDRIPGSDPPGNAGLCQ